MSLQDAAEVQEVIGGREDSIGGRCRQFKLFRVPCCLLPYCVSVINCSPLIPVVCCILLDPISTEGTYPQGNLDATKRVKGS